MVKWETDEWIEHTYKMNRKTDKSTGKKLIAVRQQRWMKEKQMNEWENRLNSRKQMNGWEIEMNE